MVYEYIIITPAYNEADYIERTIKSVIAQTALPKKWIIVDDGSTDDMAKTVKHYASEYDWIEYFRREKVPAQSYYGSNVYAIMEGYLAVKQDIFDYIAILDADITLPKDYYEKVIARLGQDEKLGVTSGVYMDLVDGKLRKILNDRRSTPKAIQVFRRECFDMIGGFKPLKYGGEDTCSCVMARMAGWKSWSFADISVVHNRPVGTGHSSNLLKIRFRQGVNEYFLATQPLFLMIKSLRRCFKERPLLLGGLVRIAGFLYGYFMKEDRQISKDMVKFIQQEQLERLFNFNKVPDGQKVSKADS